MNNTMTVKELIEALKQYPDDSKCWAYEGEFIGVVVEVEGEYKEIPCKEWG